MASIFDKKNPSLRRYFFAKAQDKTLTAEFTTPKIKEILQKELKIDVTKFSELVMDVCVEVFDYYIRAWPKWSTVSTQNINIAYTNFKIYLRGKLLTLQTKEKQFINEELDSEYGIKFDYTLTPPREALSLIPVSNFKTKLPYSLQVLGPPEVMSLVAFEEIQGRIVANFDSNPKPTDKPSLKRLSPIGILNHPFVNVVLEIPSLIKFMRKNTHKIEMFLCKPTDNWTFPKQDRIIDIDKKPPRSNIYTLKFMKEFFNTLSTTIENYGNLVAEIRKNEINFVCSEFLKDILEANLNFASIQECTEICYCIGDSKYYSDSAKSKEEMVNLRKVYGPQLTFILYYCKVTQNDIKPDGTIKSFDFNNREKDPSSILSGDETEFINRLKKCLYYTCSMCSACPFHDLTSLRNHLLITHPCTDILVCTKCNSEGNFYDLLDNRWRHECPT